MQQCVNPERLQAYCDLLDLPDDVGMRRAHALKFEGDPDRHLMVPELELIAVAHQRPEIVDATWEARYRAAQGSDRRCDTDMRVPSNATATTTRTTPAPA